MPLTETRETQAMLDEIDRLDQECENTISRILMHNVKCGKLKPTVFEANRETQEYLACKLDADYAAKRKRIHDLNLSWHIAHGLY